MNLTKNELKSLFMRRIFQLILFLHVFVISNAQLDDKRTFFAKSVNIHGDEKKKIGKIIKIEGLTSYMWLKSCSQKNDITGNFITEFKFSNPNHLAPLNFVIILQFDRQVDSVFSTSDSLAENVRTTFPDSRMGTSYSASSLKAEGILTMTVRSKRKIFTSITWIQGEMQ